jgi:exodeoxyribonuclease-3
MKIATWNVNSIRARERHVLDWLRREQPDLLVLQEIKCEASGFPAASFEALGYRCAVVGQKAYNGVALLGRLPFTQTRACLPGGDPATEQARYLEVEAGSLTVGGLYLPNGNSGGEDGYRYKLAWMDRLNAHAQSLIDADTPAILLGDFNVCPEDSDFAQGTLGPADALVRPETRARFRRLAWMGYTDALRALQPHGPAYTFWDYQAGCWQRDRGLRIDHAMLSPAVAERLTSVARHRDERGRDQPSDHVPVTVELEF